MNNRIIWEVDFDVIGPISINNEIVLRQEKGFDFHQFYSDIKLRKSPSGIAATITAYANTSEIAETVAHVYFGRMRDVLSLNINLPIALHTKEGSFNRQMKFKNRRILTKEDIKTAFNMAREFEGNEPTLLRAIGWYSKGKITQNTLDKFLAFWNVIEILGIKYHETTERTSGEGKTKNKIFQCFIDYFGPIETWPVPKEWINNMYKKRNKIAHGLVDTTVEAINNISELIPEIETISLSLINEIINVKSNSEA